MNPDEILNALFLAMALDNGRVNYEPTAEQYKNLLAAIKQMQGARFVFTGDAVDLIVTGERAEVQEQFKRVPGFVQLDKLLDEVFNNNEE